MEVLLFLGHPKKLFGFGLEAEGELELELL